MLNIVVIKLKNKITKSDKVNKNFLFFILNRYVLKLRHPSSSNLIPLL